jgi:hypothetical protein
VKIIATEEGAGNEIRRPIVRAASVVEQRISHFLMGLAIIGTMTGPLLTVLHTMPRALFSGVFFVVGVRRPPHPLFFEFVLPSLKYLTTGLIQTVGFN